MSMTYAFLMRVEPVRLADMALNESLPVGQRMAAQEALAARAPEIDGMMRDMDTESRVVIVGALALDLSQYTFSS